MTTQRSWLVISLRSQFISKYPARKNSFVFENIQKKDSSQKSSIWFHTQLFYTKNKTLIFPYLFGPMLGEWWKNRRLKNKSSGIGTIALATICPLLIDLG